MNRPPPILCLDFDGVIHSYVSGWKGADIIPDPPVPGAIEFLREAVNHFSVHIFSSRSHQEGGITAMREWIGYWMVQERVSDHEDLAWASDIEFPLKKPPALVTIDDRALTFTGLWPEMDQLKGFKPWNKVGATPSGEALSAKCDDNAQLWAQAFCTAFPYAGVDESLMTVWFAAAIERACDVRNKRQDKEPVKIEGGHGGEVRG